MNTLAIAAISVLLADGTASTPLDPLTVAREFVAKAYFALGPVVGPRSKTALVTEETEDSPAVVKLDSDLAEGGLLVVTVDVFKGHVEFLTASGPSGPRLPESQRDGRIRAALETLSKTNGWHCREGVTTGKKPGFVEAECRDPQPPPYTQGLHTVIFTESGGFLTLLGAPGPPPAGAR